MEQKALMNVWFLVMVFSHLCICARGHLVKWTGMTAMLIGRISHECWMIHSSVIQSQSNLDSGLKLNNEPVFTPADRAQTPLNKHLPLHYPAVSSLSVSSLLFCFICSWCVGTLSSSPTDDLFCMMMELMQRRAPITWGGSVLWLMLVIKRQRSTICVVLTTRPRQNEPIKTQRWQIESDISAEIKSDKAWQWNWAGWQLRVEACYYLETDMQLFINTVLNKADGNLKAKTCSFCAN